MPEHRADPAPRLWLALLALIAAVTAGAVVHQAPGDTLDDAASSTANQLTRGSDTPSADPSSKLRSSTRSAIGPAYWVREFRRLDSIREAAWHTGRPAGLRTVYTPGSDAFRIDEKRLSSYARRALIVRAVSVDLFKLQVVRRHAGYVWLEVVDQLGPAVAVDRRGHESALPRDQPTEHRIELRRVDGEWRIATITTVLLRKSPVE